MLYLVMEHGDTDLSTLFKSMSKSGDMSVYTLSSYWERMLSAVLILHREGTMFSILTVSLFAAYLCCFSYSRHCTFRLEAGQLPARQGQGQAHRLRHRESNQSGPNECDVRAAGGHPQLHESGGVARHTGGCRELEQVKIQGWCNSFLDIYYRAHVTKGNC